ncbi:hypothetical protein PCANC_16995 [Puccinia coronata f. sp. avenae]|uniref:Uncharacterized protein n=1 Tax=Puccinia coronata f. sp. avenae TaxID=200324 RepID=A0A2N5SLS3_9BASI|nr:hypothetical protein PCANC_16995 [Puccinia coronata f. sp. avenae]
MLALKAISVLSIAAAFVTAHPPDNQLVARGFNGVTTTETATQSYQSLTTEIRTLRVNIATGKVEEEVAITQFKSFSYEATSTMTSINGCSLCYHPTRVSSLTQYAKQTYVEFDLLFETCYQVYGERASRLLTHLSPLDSQCQRNLSLFSENGVHLQHILPPNFIRNVNRAGWPETHRYASRFFVN